MRGTGSQTTRSHRKDAVKALCNLQFIIDAGEELVEDVSFQALEDVSFGLRKEQAGGFFYMPHQT